MIEEKQQELQRQKEIGKFFTPQSVVEFIYDILRVHLDKEEKWKQGKFPSIVDPACGEGIFLKVALDKAITKPIYIFGIDIDEKAKEKWIEINLLKSFGSKAELDVHFYHQNGLSPLPEKVLRYKRGGLNQYDLVVGNPPYGGLGVEKEMQLLSECFWEKPTVTSIKREKIVNLFGETEEETRVTKERLRLSQKIEKKKLGELRDLSKALLDFEIWRKGYYRKDSFKDYARDIEGVRFKLSEMLTPEEINRLKSFPIEVLFIERFIQLTKPGGHIAIIIPDGILSNSNLHYVREFISKKVKVNAVISLPRGTFKDVGTSAKTSILFMTKPKENEKISTDYKVFLAVINRLENLNSVYEYYEEVSQMNSGKKDLVKVINDTRGNEVAMVRADKTLKEMMKEKPGSRWNPEYWHIKFTNLSDDVLPKLKWKIECIGNYEDFITYGPIVTGKEFKNEKDGVIIINQEEILFTGLDLSTPNKAKENSPWVIERAKPKENDLLLARSGVGGVGKNKITILDKKVDACVGCFVDILRLKGINPFYVLVFWKGYFGWNQIDRIINGVGTVNISFDEIRSIKTPLIPDAVQKHIESEYKKMSAYHDKAIDAKAKSDENSYKKNIETAEKMLKDLIARTEAVIRGERKDVI